MVGGAVGSNVNVAWTRPGMGDDEYVAVWERDLLPLAREFEPDLILVSAGFDGAAGDVGECNVTPAGFGLLTAGLMTLNEVPIVCALEGGYVRSVLSASVKAVVKALLDPTSPQQYREHVSALTDDDDDLLNSIDASAAKSICATRAAQAPYWKCFSLMK